MYLFQSSYAKISSFVLSLNTCANSPKKKPTKLFFDWFFICILKDICDICNDVLICEPWRWSHTDVRVRGKVNSTHGRNAQDRTGCDKTWHDRASHAHGRSKHAASPSRMGRRHAGMSHDRTGAQQHIFYCGCFLWLLTVDTVSCCYLSSTATLVPPCLAHLSTTNTNFTNSCVGRGCPDI